VLGLGERALGTGRGDLERVLLAHRREVPGDPLAELERDAAGVVDEQADEGAPDDLGEQYLDLGLRLGETGLDVGLDRAHVHLHSFMKKAGERPLSETCDPVAATKAVVLRLAPKATYAAFAARSRYSR
jgi:hypothetical protein